MAQVATDSRSESESDSQTAAHADLLIGGETLAGEIDEPTMAALSDTVVLSVCGRTFYVPRKTLLYRMRAASPDLWAALHQYDSCVGKRSNGGASSVCAFVDRDPDCFAAILAYVRVEQLERPEHVCSYVWMLELEWWGFAHLVAEPLRAYRHIRNSLSPDINLLCEFVANNNYSPVPSPATYVVREQIFKKAQGHSFNFYPAYCVGPTAAAAAAEPGATTGVCLPYRHQAMHFDALCTADLQFEGWASYVEQHAQVGGEPMWYECEWAPEADDDSARLRGVYVSDLMRLGVDWPRVYDQLIDQVSAHLQNAESVESSVSAVAVLAYWTPRLNAYRQARARYRKLCAFLTHVSEFIAHVGFDTASYFLKSCIHTHLPGWTVSFTQDYCLDAQDIKLSYERHGVELMRVTPDFRVTDIVAGASHQSTIPIDSPTNPRSVFTLRLFL